MISQRTSAGLQAAKAKGVKLGNQEVADANRAAAKERAEALRPVLEELAGQSANAIAKALNARNVATPTGSPWSAKTVIRVQRRLKLTGRRQLALATLSNCRAARDARFDPRGFGGLADRAVFNFHRATHHLLRRRCAAAEPTHAPRLRRLPRCATPKTPESSSRLRVFTPLPAL